MTLRRNPGPQPWLILTRHFLQKYFEPDVEASAGELRTGIAAVLGLSATPGLILCALLFEKYSSLVGWLKGILQIERDLTSLPDKYVFLTMAFTVSGLVSVLKWDSLFPDRKDYMILAVLPLRARTIFAAKVLALVLFVSSFSVAVNIMGALFFPAVVLGNNGTMPGLIRYGLSHASATLAASTAGALLVITTAGLLLNIASRQIMRRFSSWLQFALFVFFVAQILISLRIANAILVLRDSTSWTHLMFPPLWFLGLYEQLLGRSGGSLQTWASWSWMALGGGSALAVLLYLLSYFRHFRRTAEDSDIAVAPGRMLRILPMLKDPIAAGISEFVRQTIGRSGPHRLLFRIFLGAGCAVILHGVVSYVVLVTGHPSGIGPLMLAGPLIISYFLLAGLRFLLDVPIQQPSSWVFKLLLDDASRPAILLGVRRVMFELGIVAWLLAIIPLNILLLGLTVGLAHSVFCLLVSLIFLEALLFGYRRVPFTSAFDSGNSNLGMALFLWLSVFLIYAYGTTAMEVRLLARPALFVCSLVLLYAAWRLLIHARERYREPDQALEFSDGTVHAVLTLNLQGK
jgi:hypothetical protein